MKNLFTFLTPFFKALFKSSIFNVLFYSALFMILWRTCSIADAIAITLGFFAALLNDIHSNSSKIRKYLKKQNKQSFDFSIDSVNRDLHNMSNIIEICRYDSGENNMKQSILDYLRLHQINMVWVEDSSLDAVDNFLLLHDEWQESWSNNEKSTSMKEFASQLLASKITFYDII